jgi:hypothetical protein
VTQINSLKFKGFHLFDVILRGARREMSSISKWLYIFALKNCYSAVKDSFKQTHFSLGNTQSVC